MVDSKRLWLLRIQNVQSPGVHNELFDVVHRITTLMKRYETIIDRVYARFYEYIEDERVNPLAALPGYKTALRILKYSYYLHFSLCS